MSRQIENEILIMQYKEKINDWADVTSEVQWFSEEKNCCKVKYFGNEIFYPIGWGNISIYKNPKKIDFHNHIVLLDNKRLFNLEKIIQYDRYYKIFYLGERSRVYEKSRVSFIKDKTAEKPVKSLLDYLANVAALMANDGQDFLKKQIENIEVLENSLLSKFIENKFDSKKYDECIIYPFKTNLSQKKAVMTALENDFSIIQGPPGTGKTQTILNIVANFIAREKCVAVLSGNNEATKNVKEKLDKEGLGKINAVLGNKENIDSFFANTVKESADYKEIDVSYYKKQVLHCSKTIDTILSHEIQVAQLAQTIDDFTVEKSINDAEYMINKHIVPDNIKKLNYTSEKFISLAATLELLPQKKIKSFFNRARLLFRYGIIKVKDIADNKDDIVEYLKNNYYKAKIKELSQEHNEKSSYIKENIFEDITKEFVNNSKLLLKGVVNNTMLKYQNLRFERNTYKTNFAEFAKRFPIVYSTTNAIASCVGKNFKFDCVIIDESSQVDLVTAIIAFSVAKKVVLVGDNMQITNVIDSKMVGKLKSLFDSSGLQQCYDYTQNNILQCIQKKNKNIPSTLLNEHYRCDPQIIGFCNKKFYGNKLILRTNHTDGNGVVIIRHGSHFERDRTNERQVDIIEKEVMTDILGEDIGVIAPYNNQVNLLKSRLKDKSLTIDTVHKFQGREKDIIILSTVSNKIKFYEDDSKIDFMNNPNLINVAISRAKNKLVLLASEELLDQEGSILKDLSRYFEYYCSATKVVNTRMYSVFDLMYSDYSPVLENLRKKLLNISDHKSENIIATLLKDICECGKYGALNFLHNYPLKNIIKKSCYESQDDAKFVENINTHCDFVLYSAIDKSIRLIVEVDGSQHKRKIQSERDKRKDRLLERAGLKILRLSTLSIDCEEKIVDALKI